MKKVVSIIFGILLLLFALFQFNDIDPALWILFYGIGAALCFGNLVKNIKSLKWVNVAYIIISVFYAIFNWPEVWMGFDQSGCIPNINVEKARESCGLLIASLFVFVARIIK